MNIITLKQARRHVNLDHHEDDDELEDMRAFASGAVLDYLKHTDPSDTTYPTEWFDAFGEPTRLIPGTVIAATLLCLGSMYENRDGDAWRSPQVLSQSVIDLLMRQRDPSMA